MMSQDSTSDEKILAGVAYLLGLIPALIIWALKKEGSSYVRFHAVQAALFDGFVSLVAFLLLFVQFLVIAIMMGGTLLATNIIADTFAPETPLVYMIISIILMLMVAGGISLIAVLILILNLIDLVAAMRVFTGKEWQYPVFGAWAGKINQKAQI